MFVQFLVILKIKNPLRLARTNQVQNQPEIQKIKKLWVQSRYVRF